MSEENKIDKAEISKVEPRNKVANLSEGIYSSSDTFALSCQMAKGLASSTLVPQAYMRNEANCLIALELSNRFGISPLMVMQNTFIIQGKPSFSSSFMIAMINGSGKYDMELQYEEKNDKDGKPYSCKCWTMKDGRRVEGMEVTMDMADKEGWTKKTGSKWITLPSLMLRYRSATFFARTQCPELMLGFHTQDEYEDMGYYDDSKKSKKSSLNDVLKEDIEVESVVVE